MKTTRHFALTITALVLALCATLAASDDPPSRVARLQYVSGSVSVQPGGVNDWVDAALNRPLTTADRVWTDKDSRSELHLGGAFLRMDAMTSLTLTNLADQTAQLQLDQGTVNLRIRHLYDGEIYEVDTPNMAFTVTKSGEYRFDVDPDGDTTRVTVWKGEGEATGQDRGVKVRKGEQAVFSGGNSLNHEIAEAPQYDGFDDWCRVRNDRQDHSQAVRYVSPDVIGAEDLDSYGTWRVTPGYGPVWVPAVAPGWAPYHYGHWAWIEPWGWTWVDDAPWGFAPAHYGRWVYYNSYWGWVPGPVAVRPVYAPALVAWVGGSNWGVSMSFGGGGGVGWFPLGYGEPYIPPYRVSRNYFQNVNVSNTHITNITNVTNNYYVNNTTNVTNTNVTKIVYKNQTVPGAMMAVPKTAMVNAQPVYKAAVQVPADQMRHAPLAMAPDVAPSKASVLAAREGAVSSMPPAHMSNRPVVSRMAPPERPVPFVAKQEALARNPGRPLDRDTEKEIRARVAQESPRGRGDEPAPTRGMNPVTQPAQRPVPVAGENRQGPQPLRPMPNGNDKKEIAQPAAKGPASGSDMDDRSGRNVPHPPSRNASPVQTGQSFPARVVPRPPDRNAASQAGAANPVDRTPAASPSVRSTATDTARPGAYSTPRPQQNATMPEAAPRRVENSRNVDSPASVQTPAVKPVNDDSSRPAGRQVARPPENSPTRVVQPDQPRNVESASPVQAPSGRPVSNDSPRENRQVPRPTQNVATPQRAVQQEQPRNATAPANVQRVPSDQNRSQAVERPAPRVVAQPQRESAPAGHVEKTRATSAPAKSEGHSNGEHGDKK